MLVLETTNPGKVREIKALLKGLPWMLIPQSEFGFFDGVDEDGATYAENALTFAELEQDDKNRLSHRGRALTLVHGMLSHDAAWLRGLRQNGSDSV